MSDPADIEDAPVEWGEIEEPRNPHRLFSLKDGDVFLVSDSHGDVIGTADGLFHDDTRILSRWVLHLGEHSPTLLSGAISQDNVYFTSHGLNRAIPAPGGPSGLPGVLHVERKRFLWEERLYERITLTNYNDAPMILPLALELGADFKDMFEVRGARRRRRGQRADPEVRERSVRFRYLGLDGVERISAIVFSSAPASLSERRAEFRVEVGSRERAEMYVEIGAREDGEPGRERFRAAAARARAAMRARRRRGARVKSHTPLFNAWIDKSRADLALLSTPMQTGPYPYAGIPWFSTAFGRDGIITAWQLLWLDPTLACGVLSYLASQQADEVSAFRDSEPGKIIHEVRRGEMAALGEVPFGRYYGGVDTTPLFVALAGAYAARTGDMAQIARWWPALERAAAWIVRAAERHPLGFLSYARGAETGLANQGWKDSHDSVFHADGQFPRGPIALVEVQGYVYAAYQSMASLSERRGDPRGRDLWRARAKRMREAVERAFWMEDRAFYGLALDGEGRLAAVSTSNPGHLLFVGLPSRARARHVTGTLLGGAFYTGWGIRTVAAREARYNPMSYHNGSVWPHDTALACHGLARYGEREGVVKLISAMWEVAVEFEMRLPELFCGFSRATGEAPVAYPVACLPQSWAAGSLFMMLQACLGLRIDGAAGCVEIDDPALPVGIDRLELGELDVGGERIDLTFERQGARISVHSNSRGPSLRVRYS